MTGGPGRVLAALILASSCVACAETAAVRPVWTPDQPAPALSGVAGELVAVTASSRPSLVRIRKQTELLKPASEYAWGLLETLLGAINPTPWYDWPYRLLGLPLYLVFGPFDFGDSVGSGFFVGPDLVVTNHHVVENAAELRCELVDGRRCAARVLADDPDRDLALLRVEGLEGPAPPSLRLRRSPLRPGEPVLAMGFPSREMLTGRVLPVPLGDELSSPPNPTVTCGILTAIDVDLGSPGTEYLETDAALNPGNSGGPLVGLDGTVVGVSTLVAVGKQSEGYAVPVGSVWLAFGERLGAQAPADPGGEQPAGGDPGAGR